MPKADFKRYMGRLKYRHLEGNLSGHEVDGEALERVIAQRKKRAKLERSRTDGRGSSRRAQDARAHLDAQHGITSATRAVQSPSLGNTGKANEDDGPRHLENAQLVRKLEGHAVSVLIAEHDAQ